jgi:putative DNA primase/helicase
METEEDWVPNEEPTAVVSLLPGRFNCTDLGNCERLVAAYRDEVRYCPQRKKWLNWDGSRWRWDEIGTIERKAKSVVRAIMREADNADDEDRAKTLRQWSYKSEDSKRIKSLVSLAQTEAGIPVLLDELDADPFVLNAKNGTVDLRTGELREHRKSDLITRTTGIEYEFGAQSELWDRVLSEACGGDAELAAYIQAVAGYSLIGVPLERAFFFLHGPPGTAKSTIIDAMHAAMGGYAEGSDSDTWLQKPQVGGNRGDLVRLAGSRLVTASEFKPGTKWDEAIIKKITGGDLLTFAAKYEADVTFKPSFSLLFAANDAPSAREDDDGFWVRMKRIPLTHEIPMAKQDKHLKLKLQKPKHAKAILFWAVKGCAAYISAKGFPACSAVESSTQEYRAELDHFSTFLTERVEFDADFFVTRKDLRKAYERWAEEVGRKVLLDARAVAKKLRARGCKDGSPRHGYETWSGIQLRSLGFPEQPDEARWR